ncbi:MAG: hypothetical protein PME_46580 [Priestia megaterium]
MEPALHLTNDTEHVKSLIRSLTKEETISYLKVRGIDGAEDLTTKLSLDDILEFILSDR